jgi:hypothetical protein
MGQETVRYELQSNYFLVTKYLELSPQDVADFELSLLSILLPLILTKPPKSLSGLLRDRLFDRQKILRVKRFHLQFLAGPIDSKQQPPQSRLIGLSLLKQ